MRTSNFALRLQPSLLEEARRIAEEEGVALDKIIFPRACTACERPGSNRDFGTTGKGKCSDEGE